MGVWRAKPALVAAELTEKTGIKVIAAEDGMTLIWQNWTRYRMNEIDNAL